MSLVYGMGNPLMDVICRVDHLALESLGVAPGSMNLVEHEQQESIIAATSVAKRLPGGSCANTIRAIAFLSGDRIKSPVYTGGVGTDETGDAFHRLLEDEHVISRLGRKTIPTGRSVILVTPDGQRTMFTFLGACREMTVADVDVERLRAATVFHTTGYMWDTPGQEEAARSAMEEARRHGVLVSFDIADPFVVGRFRAKLLEWLPGRTDLLFANREELSALTGVSGPDEAVVRAAFTLAPTVLMKIGAGGAYLGDDSSVRIVPGYATNAFDTTGAGDAFAGGFLFGLVEGRPNMESARLANRIASEIVKVDGCDYSTVDRKAVLANEVA